MNKIPELEQAFPDDPIALKVAYMIATSHEYKDKPNIEAGIKFAKNYRWKESEMPLSKLEGINKPVIKEKVFEIAKSLDKGNEWPLVVVDKIHGIYPQSPNKKILFDGHHRKEAMDFRGITSTPVYYGVYTGNAEKDVEDLIATEGITAWHKKLQDLKARRGKTPSRKSNNSYISEEEFESKYETEINKIHSECKVQLTKILRKPEHKLASKGFAIEDYTDVSDIDSLQMYTLPIVSWDLWDVYPDARTRFGDGNCHEFDALWKELSDCIKSIAIKYFKTARVESNDDWDGGTIDVAIPYSSEFIKTTESFLGGNYMSSLDNFITTCESNLIATEGVNWETAKMIRDEDVKKARALLKEAKKLVRRKNVDDVTSAIEKLKESKTLIVGMKHKVDQAPETLGFWSRVASAFTPIFTMLPVSELDSVTPGMYVGSGGSYGTTLTFNYKEYVDKMSEDTHSNVKRRLQLTFNLFLKNLDKSISSYQKELSRLKQRESMAKESYIDDLDMDPVIESVMFDTLDVMTLAQENVSTTVDVIKIAKDYKLRFKNVQEEYRAAIKKNDKAAVVGAINKKIEILNSYRREIASVEESALRNHVALLLSIITIIPFGAKVGLHVAASGSHPTNMKGIGNYTKNAYLLWIDEELKSTKNELSLIKANKSDIVTEAYEQLDAEDEAVLESVFVGAMESKMSSEQRASLPDSAFGLPSKRKYPLYLASKEESVHHISQALKFFMYCPNEDRKELAQNIKKAAEKYKVEIPEKSLVRKYF